MNVARHVHQIYREHPYPTPDANRTEPLWTLPPWEWMSELWRPGALPRRILVAGCGTGNEAFALHGRFPEAEIVGVDFSGGSIAMARRLQRSKKLRGLRFVVGDLGDAQLPRRLGGTFDLITCHGVLAYVPRWENALRSFADLLAPDGALCLGMNGAAHFSTRWRTVLADFGFDATKAMPKNERLPNVVALLDSISGDALGQIAKEEASFLPTDLFGPLIQNVGLKELLAKCRASGLHFLGVHDHHRPFRSCVGNESYLALMPRSRAAVAEIIDALRPAGFHRLLLTKNAPVEPPWDACDELAAWRPSLAPHLREHRLPTTRPPWRWLREFTIKSVVMNLRLDLRTSGHVWELLRCSGGADTLGEILARTRGSLRDPTVRKHLYLLHQLYLLDLLPPAPRDANAP